MTLTKAFKARVEESARKAGWAPKPSCVLDTDDACWVCDWILVNDPPWKAGLISNLGAIPHPEKADALKCIYLLAAKLLGVKEPRK